MEANRSADNPVGKAIVALNAQSKLIASIADNMKLDTDVVDDDASGCDTENPTQACE